MKKRKYRKNKLSVPVCVFSIMLDLGMMTGCSGRELADDSNESVDLLQMLDTVQSCLTIPYVWDIEVYAGTETISDYNLKGLEDIGKEEAGSSKVISLEYKNNEREDAFQYLTLEFVKQESGWKIQFCGME